MTQLAGFLWVLILLLASFLGILLTWGGVFFLTVSVLSLVAAVCLASRV